MAPEGREFQGSVANIKKFKSLEIYLNQKSQLNGKTEYVDSRTNTLHFKCIVELIRDENHLVIQYKCSLNGDNQICNHSSHKPRQDSKKNCKTEQTNCDFENSSQCFCNISTKSHKSNINVPTNICGDRFDIETLNHQNLATDTSPNDLEIDANIKKFKSLEIYLNQKSQLNGKTEYLDSSTNTLHFKCIVELTRNENHLVIQYKCSLNGDNQICNHSSHKPRQDSKKNCKTEQTNCDFKNSSQRFCNISTKSHKSNINIPTNICGDRFDIETLNHQNLATDNSPNDLEIDRSVANIKKFKSLEIYLNQKSQLNGKTEYLDSSTDTLHFKCIVELIRDENHLVIQYKCSLNGDNQICNHSSHKPRQDSKKNCKTEQTNCDFENSSQCFCNISTKSHKSNINIPTNICGDRFDIETLNHQNLATDNSPNDLEIDSKHSHKSNINIPTNICGDRFEIETLNHQNLATDTSPNDLEIDKWSDNSTLDNITSENNNLTMSPEWSDNSTLDNITSEFNNDNEEASSLSDEEILSKEFTLYFIPHFEKILKRDNSVRKPNMWTSLGKIFLRNVANFSHMSYQ
ncbi:asparagine-rich protein-like [Diaphorina citri]|uniref:Asparagine-rich protein-like n=1 Tax=Diaphorina citri TaxID=121845 RepID=A0A3Q0J6I9_DIACI|nr:asparagine-rich protein-like [Diaphorina citri]